jgi:mannitol/fructose-specific phosphotransferase system IIA component (Ntr-type)
MKLAQMLDPSVVEVPVESFTREEVIAELVELLVRADEVDDREGVLDALYERERKGSTGIGNGVAVPHARHRSIDGAVLAVGIAPDGIEFEAVDDEPVYLVFLLLGSPDQPSLTIEALADIGMVVQIPDVQKRLLNANNARDVIDIIDEAQENE